MKKKPCYERPILIELSRETAEGRCGTGSAVTVGSCKDGANPQGDGGVGALPQDGCGFGLGAYGKCSTGQQAATAGCQNGTTPVAQCATGSSK
jgi:hypothetical protein